MPLQRFPVEPLMSLADQLTAAGPGPVFSTNRYEVDPRLHDDFLAAWQREVRFMKVQDGFIGTQLYRGVGPQSSVLFNLATWESGGALRAAGSADEFRRLMAAFPAGRSYPHLVRPVAVPGICLGQ